MVTDLILYSSSVLLLGAAMCQAYIPRRSKPKQTLEQLRKERNTLIDLDTSDIKGLENHRDSLKVNLECLVYFQEIDRLERIERKQLRREVFSYKHQYTTTAFRFFLSGISGLGRFIKRRMDIVWENMEGAPTPNKTHQRHRKNNRNIKKR